MSSDADTSGWSFVVDETHEGMRLDVFLAHQLPQFSRVQLRAAVQAGKATVQGKQQKPSFRVRSGQVVKLDSIDVPREGPTPESIPLEILYEDEHLVAVNKPPGMVVHPARGNWRGTLTNALAAHFQSLSDVGGSHRPGIVHRLDRDTSGVILVAKTNAAHYALGDAFHDRRVEKEYWAYVSSEPDRDADRIVQPIGPHPYQREKMAIRKNLQAAREAETFYRVATRFDGFARLEVFPKTGRTHQIRVHLAHIGCPILGDKLYAGHSRVTARMIVPSAPDEVIIERQALHARRIALEHPMTGKVLEIEAPLPEDLAQLEDWLEQRRSVKKKHQRS
ncbi:MAG TPA: RluA family pseudouridine synthase [Planctomycetaceae bacterium]|nr:RluA family pseudouridine synthase [Planctomycetaceae bacterium]